MFQGVIFDMDGLMFDTEAIWADYWDPALSAFGYEVCDEFRLESLGVGHDDQLAIIRKYYGADADAEGVLDRETELVEAHLARDVPKKPGLDELLGWLDAHDMPVAVASSSPQNMIDRCLASAGLENRFDVVLSGFELPHAKPAPDIFLAAADALGCEPARTAVLEDSTAGVTAGHAGGFVTVWVPDLEDPANGTGELAHATCHDLHEVIELLDSDELG